MRWTAAASDGLPSMQNRSWRIAALLCFAALTAQRAAAPLAAEEAPPAQTDPAPGHSWHGEAFDNGPRQAARIMGGTGNVRFPATTQQPEVQAFIDQGVGQLHGFWYFEAERSFRQAAALDPDCAIAYWGMAMANANNADRARGFMEAAFKRREQASPREQLYIDALHEYRKKDDNEEGRGRDRDRDRRKALVKAYERIIDAHPEDLEAKAFLVGLLWDNHGSGLPITAYFPVDALLKEVFRENPEHPAHHYRIHLWDYENPTRALEAAAACGPAAPAIAHMWHMPGHIYSRLNRYPDACWQQEASARVDHAHMERDRILPDQIHNYAHNNEWLVRNLVYVGRAADALRMSQGLIANPQHPGFNTASGDGSFRFGRRRLCDVLSEFELWDAAMRLAESPWLPPTDREDEQVRRLRLLGRARFRSGDFTAGCAILTELKQRQNEVRHEQQTAADKALAEAAEAGKKEEERKQAAEAARNQFNGRLADLDPAVSELAGYVHRAARAWDDAQKSFDAAGKFDKGFLARFQLERGDVEGAVNAARADVGGSENQVLPRAALVEILWAAGRRDEARAEFETLRPLASDIDPTTPVFARLAGIARELDWPDDWRLPPLPREDIGPRPDLATLGPYVWRPPVSPDWSLPDADGRPHALADAAGRPVVALFSLGASCLHCNEQLKTFAAAAPRFQQAGLSVVVISVDPVENIALSVRDWRQDATLPEGDLPLTLLSDQPLDAFRAFRCFDDFEQRPLHGTFLIDSRRRLRWMDIGPEPFMDAEFLLQESQRLLSLPLESLEEPAAPSVPSTPAPGPVAAGE
ncbi:MAG: redoxin domain-containing protein [Planctomyces sp.]|nr:redoxin domain-containing protein [Planctomyces sp.]